MGDSTSLTVFVYAAPKPDEVLQILNSWGLSDGEAGLDALAYGVAYQDYEASVGATSEIGKELNETGAYFVVWTDPKYEWLGDIWIYFGQEREFYGSCDSEGTVQINAEEIDAAVHAAGGSFAELRHLFRVVTGYDARRAWQVAIAEVEAKQGAKP